jgi:hypothetical protein
MNVSTKKENTVNNFNQIEKELESLLKDKKKEPNSGTTVELLKELDRVTHELEFLLEEQKLNEYFDKQCRIYLVEQMSISKMFSAKIKPIIDLVERESIEIYSGNILGAESKPNLSKLFIPESGSEFIISLSSQAFLDSITETYTTDNMIINQFLKDFSRQHVSINDIMYTDIDDFFLKLSESNRKTTILNKDQNKMSSMMFLLLVTCQSSHYLSYLYPYNSVNAVRDEAILKSDKLNTLDKPNTTKNLQENYFVMSGDDLDSIDIIIDDIDIKPEIGCIVKSGYKIFDIQNETKIYDIKSELIFNEKSDRCLIKYIVKKV